MMEVKVKKRPISFNGESVRATLVNRKFQTRRVISPNVTSGFDLERDGSLEIMEIEDKYGDWVPILDFCPYGKVGDLLYVREKWCVHKQFDSVKPSELPELKYLPNGITYLADVYKEEKSTWMGKTRPSIFLPKKYSRILLEMTEKRVERVQDIDSDDAIAEGITEPESMRGYIENGITANGLPTEIYLFKELWDSINAKRGYPWESNPFVWIVVFKRLIDSKELHV